MDGYESFHRIGRGNYGTVFRVRQKRAAADFCLKQINMECYSEADRLKAQQEVEVLRTLEHPGIVRYHEHFTHEESLCVVMAYCEGGDLAKEIKRRAAAAEQFAEAQILDWLLQIVSALSYVHTQRILHRDLKTQNIFLTGGLVKIGDFGIAKVMQGSLSAASTVIGTPYYMSPEVCQNQPYSYKSDIWALGCILHELCALQQAWTGSNLLGLVFQIVQRQPPPVPEIYSQGLRELVGLLLAKEPEHRPTLDGIMGVAVIRGHLQGTSADPPQRHPLPAPAAPSAPTPAAAARTVSTGLSFSQTGTVSVMSWRLSEAVLDGETVAPQDADAERLAAALRASAESHSEESTARVLDILRNPLWQATVESFIDSNCLLFDAHAALSETHHEAFRRFAAMVDDTLREVLADAGLEMREFAAFCSRAERSASGREVLTHLLSVEHFDFFAHFMTRRNLSLHHEARLAAGLTSTCTLVDASSCAKGVGGDALPAAAEGYAPSRPVTSAFATALAQARAQQDA